LTEPGYLVRLHNRRELQDLKRQIVFGLLAGGLLALVGAHRCYFVLAARETLWRPVMWTGLGTLALTLLLPSLWKWPERTVRWVTGTLGKAALGILLTVIYGAVFWPFGLAMRWIKGSHPIYRWREAPPEDAEGWVEKQVFVDERGVADARGPRLTTLAGAVGVVAFFIQRRQIILIPALLLLLVLAVFFFFVQTSALAPFIYTLF
jgi:hypothetical protein